MINIKFKSDFFQLTWGMMNMEFTRVKKKQPDYHWKSLCVIQNIILLSAKRTLMFDVDSISFTLNTSSIEITQFCSCNLVLLLSHKNVNSLYIKILFKLRSQ